MSGKKTAIIVSLTMVVLVGGIVAFAIIKSSPKKRVYAPIPKAVASSGAITQGSGSTLSLDGGGALGLQGNLGAGNSGGTTSSDSSAAADVPGPESFAQYDQYKDGQTAMFADLAKGTGTEVTGTSKVAVTYQGWLTNGQLFDQSRTNDEGKLEAFTFQIGAQQVIPGWEQAIIGMKVGGKRRFIVPPAAGYGATGQDPIPPNAVLIFDVVLHAAL